MRRAAGVSPVVESGDRTLALPGPDAARALRAADREPSFADGGVELRFAGGDYREPGPAIVWIALRKPVLPGTEPSPLQRAVAAADFGNGVSAVLDWSTQLFINPDLTVHLERDPEGEWVALDAETTIGADGTGQATSTLYDERGRIGHAVQALYVDTRG
jgi:hypothetical protein